MERKVLTVAELAETLRISLKTAYELASNPEFTPSFRIGKRILISAEELQKWINSGAKIA